MARDGGAGPLPFRLTDFLSSSYHIIAIIVVLLGLTSFVFSVRWKVDALEEHQKEHPTKQEMAELVAKIEHRVSSLEKHIEELDLRGTRALADRTTMIEQINQAQSDRLQEGFRRLVEQQSNISKINSEISTIIERQNVNTAAIRDLQQRVWSSPPRLPP